jgi:hypothetical protein
MSARFPTALAAALVLGVLSVPAVARDEPQAKAKAPEDPVASLIEKLHTGEVPPFEGEINNIPLFELLARLSKVHGVNFVINEEVFKATGVNDVKDKKPNLSTTQLRGLTLHDFLTTVLPSMHATYMVKGKAIEIVPPSFAAKLTKVELIENENESKSLAQPLVSAVFKEKPLNEAVALIAERYDLTVVVSPQAADAKAGFVTARLLNVPADKAVELLAVQCELQVVRKGTAFLITSKEHADAMFHERIEKERVKIELEHFRKAPPPKPVLPVEPKFELVPVPVLEPKPPVADVIFFKRAANLEIPLKVQIPQPKPQK